MIKILKFGASWCQPCKQMKSTLDVMDIDYPIEEIDVDENQEMSAKYGIRSVPTLIIVEGDKILGTSVGSKSAPQIKEFIQKSIGEVDVKV